MKSPFDLQSIAIIGASADPKKLGNQLLKNLIKARYGGKIFPINLKEKIILKLKAYSSVLDIHQKIDLAVIIIPREIVPQVLSQCALKEIPYVLIISAGFAEKDALGKKLQEKIIKISQNSKTTIIGPNCLGLIDTVNKINLTFAASDVIKGPIGLILQSGAIGAAIFDWAKENNVGISKFISLGNKVQFSEIEALEILANDPNTNIIALYLENITKPAKFLDKCRQVSKIKPVIILKGGSTKLGAKAASSHTAALSSPEELNEAIYAQANLIVARDFEELINFLELFGTKTFNLKEKTLSIITNAGGLGILAADAANRSNLTLPRLTKSQQNFLSKTFSSFASLENPFDLGGDALASSYREILNLVEKAPQYASILVILTPQASTEVEKTAQIISTYKNSRKPVIASFLGGSKIARGIQILKKSHIPCYDDPAEALALLGKIYLYYRKKISKDSIIEIKSIVNQIPIPDDQIVKNYNLPFAKSYNVNSDADVMGHIEEVGFPIVYKTAKNIVHKGKSGKVGLNISDHQALKRAIEVIGYPGILQEMVESPFEVLVGAKRHPDFGPAVIFGQGGIFTEENADISLKLLPLTAADLNEMIEGVRIWDTIKKFKVKDQILGLIITMGKIILENPDISEIELNPIKISVGSIKAVDINIQRNENE